jgi:hypothetical protein
MVPAMEKRSITCFDCDTLADAPADIVHRDGFTCRNCGSRFKVLNVQGIPIRIRMTSSVIRARGYRKTPRRPPQKLQGTPPQSSSRTYKVQVSDLDDDPTSACVVDVSRADGTPITRSRGNPTRRAAFCRAVHAVRGSSAAPEAGDGSR